MVCSPSYSPYRPPCSAIFTTDSASPSRAAPPIVEAAPAHLGRARSSSTPGLPSSRPRRPPPRQRRARHRALPATVASSRRRGRRRGRAAPAVEPSRPLSPPPALVAAVTCQRSATSATAWPPWWATATHDTYSCARPPEQAALCLQGMKIVITVHPLWHNASSNGSRRARRASAATRRTRSAAWLAAITVAAAAVGAFC